MFKQLITAVLCFVLLHTSAQTNLDSQLGMDPTVRTGVLPNGMKYYVKQNKKPEKRAELRLAVNVGSNAEDDDQQGLAHFLEHMAFNGTKNFKKNELVDYLESVGTKFGPHLNAYTSFDETVYMLQVPTDTAAVLEKGFQILEDWSYQLSLDPVEIDKERGVVIEEWRLGQGAQERMRRQYWPTLFRGSRYADRLPIGKKEILETFKYDVVKRFYEDWYRTDLMAVIAVGDFDPDLIEKMIKERFSKVPSKSTKRELKVWPVPDQKEMDVMVVTDKENQFNVIQHIYRLPVEASTTVKDYRSGMLSQLYALMFQTRLAELQKSTDPPFLFAAASYENFVRNKNAFITYAVVKQDGIIRGTKVITEENQRVKQFGFTEGELERAKKSYFKSIESAYNERDKSESANYAREYVANFLEKEPIPGIIAEFEMTKDLLDGITIEEINKLVGKWMANPENSILMVLATEKEGAKIPSADEVRGAFKDGSLTKVTAYVDKKVAETFMANTPSPGKVIEESKNESYNITTLKLANGATVHLKPTDFKNDEILLTANSLGGASLVEDVDYHNASMAAAIAEECGAGEFDKITIDKMLQGKNVSVGMDIGDYTESIDASCSPSDIETMFQLLYLKMTTVRKDSVAFLSMIAQQKGILENRLSVPENIFRDTVSYIMSGYNPRSKPMTIEMLSKLDMNRALQLYKKRFSDASDFTFTLVGNFDIATIKPLIETYLGGLPSTYKKENFRDLGVSQPLGKIEKEVKKGVEPKSSVAIKYNGTFKYDRKSRFEMNALLKLLSIKLRENLREEKGGVYGVGAFPSMKKMPKGYYEITIGFGCAPTNVKTLVDACEVEIKAIKANGCDDKNLTKVRETFLRERETYLKENSFWLNLISRSALDGESIDEIKDYNNWVKSLTSDDFKQLANRYLTNESYKLFVLNPIN